MLSKLQGCHKEIYYVLWLTEMSYMRDKLPSQKIFRYFEFWGRRALQNSGLFRISGECKCGFLQDPDIMTKFIFP